jgi:hypothetical protein
MRSCLGELQRLSLHGSTVRSSQIVYWGFFLRINCIHLVSVLRELRIHSGSSGVLLVHLSSVLLKDFRLVILPIRSDWTIDYTRPGADYELVTLVAIIFKFLHKVMIKRSLTVPGTDVGQTHSGSLEGKSTITVWNLASRCKFVKQFTNVTGPPALSPTPSYIDLMTLDFITN